MRKKLTYWILTLCLSSILFSCEVHNRNLMLMNVNECDSIIVTEHYQDTLMIITDTQAKKVLFSVLSHTKREIVKMPININLTFVGQNKEESIGICNKHVKIEGGFTYKCSINLEEKLRNLAKED